MSRRCAGARIGHIDVPRGERHRGTEPGERGEFGNDRFGGMAALKRRLTTGASAIQVTGPFESEGPLEWAILAELPAPELTALAFRFMHRHVVRSMWDPDEPRSWCVVSGTKKHSALIETAPGSSSSEADLATALSKDMKAPVYALGFAGYDDPDHGVPSIMRYDAGKSGLIWMADTDEDEVPMVAGPRGVPCKDPFELAAALGCELRPYFERG